MVDANMINDHVPCLFRYAAVWISLLSARQVAECVCC